MWYKSENANGDLPPALDTSSSSKYVYIRKDFVYVDEKNDENRYTPAHYEWLEQKIQKSDWDIYQKTIGHDEALNDVYAALTELAEMIVG